jgi:rfaE bifunctional protein nucleotidyltransferase chain/domain
VENDLGEHITLVEAEKRRNILRETGKKLVFTNGHFDLLHVGHLDYLEKARALGDALFVGVNGDASTRRLKGEGRPIVPENERARLLAALIPVTATMLFDEDTADSLIRALQPDIYVKGGDYALPGTKNGEPGVSPTVKFLPERVTVEAYGGSVVFIDYLPGHSTSELIARVKALP